MSQSAVAAVAPAAPRRLFRAATLRRPSFGRRTRRLDAEAAEPTGGFRITTQDMKDFLMAYSACFLAVIGLFA